MSSSSDVGTLQLIAMSSSLPRWGQLITTAGLAVALTCCRQKLANGNFAARHCTRLHQLVVDPPTTVFDFACCSPLDAETVSSVCSEFALKHGSIRPRVLAQAAHLPGNELAFVATAITNCFATAVEKAVEPLAARHRRSVRLVLEAVAVWPVLSIFAAHVVAFIGQ